MTPTEQDKKFFVEHHELFERLWKPVFGDLVLLWNGDKGEWGKDVWCVIGRFSEDAVDAIRESDGAIGAALIVDCALLARPNQLTEMLEGAGWHWMFSGAFVMEEYRYQLTIVNEEPYRIDSRGPTRAIALGRALAQAMEHEQKALKEKQHGESRRGDTQRAL